MYVFFLAGVLRKMNSSAFPFLFKGRLQRTLLFSLSIANIFIPRFFHSIKSRHKTLLSLTPKPGHIIIITFVIWGLSNRRHRGFRRFCILHQQILLIKLNKLSEFIICYYYRLAACFIEHQSNLYHKIPVSVNLTQSCQLFILIFWLFAYHHSGGPRSMFNVHMVPIKSC
jgi:hypothetical protein